MKKIVIILTLSLVFFLGGTKSVQAVSEHFYEAEYIDNIYMVRFHRITNTKYYQKARLYRRNGDQRIAYCIQPFVTFNPNDAIYPRLEQPDPTLYSKETWQRITDIAGFGYGYRDHTDLKWYAITQMMIWESIDPNNLFYFTDTLNGNRIDILQKERREIEQLIKESKKLPSFHDKTYYGIPGKTLTLTDENRVLSHFTKKEPSSAIIKENTISFQKEDQVNLEANYRGDTESVFFYATGNNQQLITAGNPIPAKAKVSVVFKSPKLFLEKVDKDTKTIQSLGEASLKGTTFTLYNKNKEKVTDITFDDQGKATIIGEGENTLIEFDTYYLQETKAGTGYQKDETVYPVTFTGENSDITLRLENESIKGKLILEKSYGDDMIMQSEANVIFEIYNRNGKLLEAIVTDEYGKAMITLPYGHYTIKQKTTTEGYTKVEPFEVFIEEKKDYTYRIYDYKEKTVKEELLIIDVPNTYQSKNPYTLLGGCFLAKKIA